MQLPQMHGYRKILMLAKKNETGYVLFPSRNPESPIELIWKQYSSFRNMDLFATLKKNSYINVNQKKKF